MEEASGEGDGGARQRRCEGRRQLWLGDGDLGAEGDGMRWEGMRWEGMRLSEVTEAVAGLYVRGLHLVPCT